MHTWCSVELSTSNVEKSNTREGKWQIYAFSLESIFLLQDSFKGINCSTTLQNPNDLSSQIDKEKKEFNYQRLAFQLSSLPPLRTYPKGQDSLWYRHLCRYEGGEGLHFYLQKLLSVAVGEMTATHRPPSSSILSLMCAPILDQLSIYLRNISVKILPFTKTGRWGQSAESDSLPSVCFTVSVTVFRASGATRQSAHSEDKFRSDETQVK